MRGLLPLAALKAAGGHWLHRVLEAGRASLIGVGHGRTLAAVAASLPRIPRPGVRFVSLLGSLTRHAAANPFDVIHRLTEITGAESRLHAGAVLRRQCRGQGRAAGPAQPRGCKFALARTAELMVVGIGEVGPTSYLLTSGMITPAELAEVERAGAVGELLGRFMDAEGRAVAAAVNERAAAVRPEEMPGRQVVAIAGDATRRARSRPCWQAACLLA